MKLFNKRLSLAIVLAFLIFLPFASSSGKVFWKHLTDKSTSIFATAGNWTQIYRTPMIINGARASLSVYGCEDSLRLVTARLKQGFSANNKNSFMENENSVRFSSTANNQDSRLLMLGMPGKDQSVIFELIQPPGEQSKPPALTSESAVFGRSFPAGSTLTSTIKNEETGALLETLTSPLPPDRAFNDISEYLAGNGWNDISPSIDNGSAKAHFRIYQRKDFLCIVMVGHAATRAGQALRENTTCVTILTKEMKR